MCAACRTIAPSQHLATSKHIDVTMDEKLENTPNCYKVYIYVSFTKNARKKPRLQLGEQDSQPGVCVPAVLDFLGSVARKWASEVELLFNVGWENPEVEDGFCGDFLRTDGIFRFF